MSLGHKNMRTEHAGAKHGKGFWGRKQDAKTASNKIRRHEAKDLVRNYEDYMGEENEYCSFECFKKRVNKDN